MNKYEQAIEAVIFRLETDLDPALYFHGVNHTRDVMRVAKLLGIENGITGQDLNLLVVAAAFHDSGHLVVYANHEEASCGIAYAMLVEHGFTKDEIDTVCQLIMATRTPQNPKSLMERILCDADLDYLGRDDYDEIAGKLYQELCEWGIMCDHKQWVETQISFLRAHQYLTPPSIANREPAKQSRISILEEKYKTM